MSTKRALIASTATGAILALQFAGTAMAQSASGPAATPEPAQGASEIVVTATRRKQTALSVPYNISAIDGRALDAAGISDLASLARQVPGLVMFDEGARDSGNHNSLSFRGLNANAANNGDDNPSKTQDTVSTYLGEAPVFFPFKLIDLQRVEVLRGPQGTLYGSGSIGGTLRYIPNAPDPARPYFATSVEASGTRHSADPSYEMQAIANIPLTDNLAVRFSGGYEHQGGWIDADGLIQTTAANSRQLGAVVLADPSSPLTSGRVKAQDKRDANDARIYFFRAAALWKPDAQTDVTLTYVFQKNEADNRNEDNPHYGNGQEYVNYDEFLSPQDDQINLVDLDVSRDFGFAKVSSSTSFSDIVVRSVSDSSGYLRNHLASYYFGFPRLYAPLLRNQNTKSVTEELRLVSAPGKVIDWVAGVYFSHQHLDYSIFQAAPGLGAYTDAVLSAPDANFGDTLAYGGTVQNYRDIATFGEVTWHVSPQAQLTGGVRIFKQNTAGTSGIPLPYASLTTEYLTNGLTDNPFLLGGFVPYSVTSKGAIFKANGSYKFDQAALLYATFSQGFRAGGSNALPEFDVFGDDNRPFLTFKPDKVNNYEVGLKGSPLRGLDYTITGFYEDWTNFQTNLYTPFAISYVANVPKTRSKGIETQISAHPFAALSIGLGYTYVDARTVSPFDLIANDATTLIAGGTPLPGSAHNSGSATIDYTVPLSGSWSSLDLHVDGSYRGPSKSSFADIPSYMANNFVLFSAITVVNLSATAHRGNLDVTVFAKNLTSNRGTSIATSPQFYGAQDAGYGVIRPLTVGLRLAWKVH